MLHMRAIALGVLHMRAIALDVNGAAGRATVVFKWLQDNAGWS